LKKIKSLNSHHSIGSKGSAHAPHGQEQASHSFGKAFTLSLAAYSYADFLGLASSFFSFSFLYPIHALISKT